jgi:competence protein ComEA
MGMRNLMRLSGLVLIVFVCLAIFQPQPPASVVVPRAAGSPAGLIRENGRLWIDLNRADEALLTAIPGVGPVLAGRIRDYLNKKGALKAPEELLNVEGIGPAKLKDIQKAAIIIP